MGRLTIDIPDALERQLDAYRRNHKLETGKMLMRSTACCRLLAQALAGVQEVPVDSLVALARRVEALEARAWP
jgi:hypothetical protein